MKATLEFSLPEEKDEFTLASHGSDYWIVLYTFDEWMRQLLREKTDVLEKCVSKEALANRIYHQLIELMEEYHVDIYEVS